jgi:hypothetical protein
MFRYKIGSIMGSAGRTLFRFLSSWEDKGVLPKTARWIKLTVLGVLAVGITTFCKKADTEPMVLCYRVAPEPDVKISELTITPNPTDGAEIVSIEATATVVEPELDSNFITDAKLWLAGDSIPHDMRTADGTFDGIEEVIKVNLSLEDIPAGTTWVTIGTSTSLGGWGSRGSYMIITDKKEE